MTPPVSIEQWLIQVREDPHILEKFKNGGEDLIELSSTSFSSGSKIKPTEFLRMRIIWHKSRRIEALGDMMTGDPNDNYTGYVSAENKSEGRKIFDAKRHLWQPYLEELKLRAAYKAWRKRTGNSESSKSAYTTMPPQPHPHRPSTECGCFYEPLRWQCLGLTKAESHTPSFDEPEERTYITKPGPGSKPTALSDTTITNIPVTPLKLEPHRQAVQDTLMDDFKDTPGVRSYYPARGGKLNKSADESFINAALLNLLQSVLNVSVEFNSMEWLPTRLPFKLMEEIRTDTGRVSEKRKLMEARVDGYLHRKSSPGLLEEDFNADALAIIEVKRSIRSHDFPQIKRQEGAEMACWISQAGDSWAGLLRSSSSGRKRRLMISQDLHEIYIIVGEYGAGFEKHIRPSKSIEQESNKPSRPMGTSAQADSSSAGSDSTVERRDPRLLAGSPAFLRRAEHKSVIVEAQENTHEGQPTKSRLEPAESQQTRRDPNLDADDFLIMNEFGPFIVTEADHMELLIKRLIDLMLELRGPEDGVMLEPLSMKFLHQTDPVRPSTPNESSSHTRRALRKSRSWPSEVEKSTQDWVMPSAKSEWRTSNRQ